MSNSKSLELKVYPLGGVGEIGSNMTVFETKNHLVIIDYGILFPYEDFFDINYLIVDAKDLDTSKEITLFITHGHEDHIGAVHHFMTNYPMAKIHAPNFAKNLLHKKFERYKVHFPILEYVENTVLHFDQFELHPIHVTHSIPDTYGLVFKNQKTGILFISDFKYDESPLFEKPFNVQKIQKLFNGLDKKIAMLDSTNILVPGKTLSESDLTADLEEIIQNKKRTFITMFSSNVYRMRNILELAKKHHRKIITIGRSIERYLDVANESGLITLSDYKIHSPDQIKNHSDPMNLFLVTGSQGEFLGATKRIIGGDQKNIALNSEDVFVFSSKPIPGNEKKIYKLYNQLSDVGAQIITFKEKKIHASGHPGQEDLKNLIDQLSLTDYIPIHGETYFLRFHIEFIKANYPKIQTHFLQNFQGFEISNLQIKLFTGEMLSPIIIHGSGIELEKEKVSERRKLACNGSVYISLHMKSRATQITTKGLPLSAEEHLEALDSLITHTAFTEFKGRDYDACAEQIRIKTRNFYKFFLGYKPITIVHCL